MQTESFENSIPMVASFADFIDAAPMMIGYIPEELAMFTVVPVHGPRLVHKVMPAIGLFNADCGMGAIEEVERRAVRLVLLIAFTKDASVGEHVLRKCIADFSAQAHERSQRGLSFPQVTAGWANSTEFAVIGADGEFGPAQPRGISDFGLAAVTSDYAQPAKNWTDYVERLSPSMPVVEHAEGVPLYAASVALESIRARFAAEPEKKSLHEREVAVLSGAAAIHLAALLESTLPGRRRFVADIWQETANRADSETRDSAFVIAAFAAWVDGDGIRSIGLLFNSRAGETWHPLVRPMRAAIHSTTSPEAWLATL